MREHLVFFDGECAVCHRAVQHLASIDSHQHLIYFPLQGDQAKHILGQQYDALLTANTLVLAERSKKPSTNLVSKESYTIWIRSRAIFRIYWIIGGKWKLLGWLSFFPGWLGDPLYRLFATFRHHIH